MEEPARALVRSQGGSGARLALRACSTCRVTQLEPQQFRVLLLHRLQLPLPLSVHSCWPTISLATTALLVHGQGSWARGDTLWKVWSREFAVRRAAESPRMFSSESWILGWLVRQMAGAWRSWRMGFPCLAELNWQSTPQWSVLCIVTGGPDRVQPTALEELVGPRARSRLVVFGVEVGGRCSRESQDFISQLARARARQEQPLRSWAEQAWRLHFMRGGTGSGRFVAGSPSNSWSGRGHSTGTGCGTGSAGSRFCLVARSHNFDPLMVPYLCCLRKKKKSENGDGRGKKREILGGRG